MSFWWRMTLMVLAFLAGVWLILVGALFALMLAMPYSSPTPLAVLSSVAIALGGALGALSLLLPCPSRSGSIVRSASACVNGGIAIVAFWITFAGASSGSLYPLLVAGPAALLVTTALLGIAPRRRPPAHLCAACGYDLRGVDVDACPECGSRR